MGKGDPHHHLRLFISDTLPVRDNKDKQISLFRKSLEGDAASWFGSLPVGSITSFEDLATNFLNQYSTPISLERSQPSPIFRTQLNALKRTFKPLSVDLEGGSNQNRDPSTVQMLV